MRSHAILVGSVLLVVTVGFAVAGSATSGYAVSANPSVDTPDRDVTFDGQTFEVSELGYVDPGNTMSATVDAPAGDSYNVRLYDADRDVLDQHRDPASDTVFFDVPEDDPHYPPGTYVVVVEHDGGIRAVTPVVVSGYHASVDAPDSAEPGSTVTVEASVTTVDDRKPIGRVQVVIGNDDEHREVTLSDDGDGTYSATFGLDTLAEGDYSLYAVVQGNDQVLDRREVLGVSDSRSISIEAGGTSGTADGGSDGGAGGGATTGPPATTSLSSGTSTPTDGSTTGTTTSLSTSPGSATGATTDDSVITPNEPSPTATSTTSPGQPLGVLPAIVALSLVAILLHRRR